MSDIGSEASQWVIKRNCSASPQQLAICFGSLVAVSFVFGVGFAAFGLWMILPFVGLELIAVGIAFLCYGRHAADVERIVVAPGTVLVERVEGLSRQRWQFDPRLSHVHVETVGRQSGKRVRIYLLAPGVKLEFGRNLLDRARAQLAKELDRSLMRARMAALEHGCI